MSFFESEAAMRARCELPFLTREKLLAMGCAGVVWDLAIVLNNCDLRELIGKLEQLFPEARTYALSLKGAYTCNNDPKPIVDDILKEPTVVGWAAYMLASQLSDKNFIGQESYGRWLHSNMWPVIKKIVDEACPVKTSDLAG